MGKAIVTFDLRAGTITVEGPTEDLSQLFNAARAVAPSLREIRVVTTDQDPGLQPQPVDPDGDAAITRLRRQHLATTSPATLASRTSPSNMSERIAVLAHYARHERGIEYFTIDDMSRWFHECDYPMPSEMRVAMADAGRKRYQYVENESRNRWRLTDKGEVPVHRSQSGSPPRHGDRQPDPIVI